MEATKEQSLEDSLLVHAFGLYVARRLQEEYFSTALLSIVHSPHLRAKALEVQLWKLIC